MLVSTRAIIRALNGSDTDGGKASLDPAQAVNVLNGRMGHVSKTNKDVASWLEVYRMTSRRTHRNI